MTYDPNDRPSLENTLFVMAAGASLPSQRQTSIRPLALGDFRGLGIPVGEQVPAGAMAYETAAEWPVGYWDLPPEQRPNVYPRNGHFMVATEISIGTIHELVEDFRIRLTDACRSVYDCDPGTCQSITNAQQQHLREVRDEFRRALSAPSGLTIPFDHDGNCALAAEYRELIETSSRFTGFDTEGRALYTFPPAPSRAPARGHVLMELPL